MNPSDWIEGMARGMSVLECFGTERQRLNATLTAQRTGLTRATARRHLLTLAHLGYLESDGQFFWLSPKVLGFRAATCPVRDCHALCNPLSTNSA